MAREIVRSVSLRKVARMTGRIPAALLDIVLPPRCGSCGAIVDAPHSLCIECWRRMRFVSAPLCHACGVPFEFDAGPEAMCADCHASAPPYRRARAALVYDDASRPVIIRFKHADRTDLAPLLARLLVQAGRDLLAECDLVVPVPLHRNRLLFRRYNQSALLARLVARAAARPMLADALVRQRATPPQGRLGRRQRLRNIAGAIAVRPVRRERLLGRRILLIDDVMTTGATVSACVRALRRAGAESVDVLTIARVVRQAGA
ncbi:MAG: ComF family protein [Rhodospirillales bacterium]